MSDTVAHHTADSACPLCEAKLLTAHPYMRDWFHRIKALTPTVHVCWAYRGKEDQEQAFRDGKSKLHYPNSPHNRINLDGKPESYALDIFQIVGGRAVFDALFYAKVNAYNVAGNEPILWGHIWKNLGDLDHFSYDPPMISSGVTLIPAA